jgi:hypothetical protein
VIVIDAPMAASTARDGLGTNITFDWILRSRQQAMVRGPT